MAFRIKPAARFEVGGLRLHVQQSVIFMLVLHAQAPTPGAFTYVHMSIILLRPSMDLCQCMYLWLHSACTREAPTRCKREEATRCIVGGEE